MGTLTYNQGNKPIPHLGCMNGFSNGDSVMVRPLCGIRCYLQEDTVGIKVIRRQLAGTQLLRSWLLMERSPSLLLMS